MKNEITIQAEINADISTVFEMFNSPKHIVNWNFASPEWHCPEAKNDFKVGGLSSCRMEAKDGSFGFDFNWTFTKIITNKLVEYTLEDGRMVSVSFENQNDTTIITEKFEPESENSRELQEQGWQAILNNFKKYVEGDKT